MFRIDPFLSTRTCFSSSLPRDARCTPVVITWTDCGSRSRMLVPAIRLDAERGTIRHREGGREGQMTTGDVVPDRAQRFSNQMIAVLALRVHADVRYHQSRASQRLAARGARTRSPARALMGRRRSAAAAAAKTTDPFAMLAAVCAGRDKRDSRLCCTSERKVVMEKKIGASR